MKIKSLLIAPLTVIFFCCNEPSKNNKNNHSSTDSFAISFSAFPPKDLDSNASPQQLVEFAWDEFLALNWKSSFDLNGMRDFPDTTWSYDTDTSAYPILNVWETYAHRTELRPYSNTMLPFDNPPHFSFGVQLLPFREGVSFGLFNNLDENNEIGSCDIYAHTNLYGKNYKVLYQARANRDEYEYLYNNYNKKELLQNATALTVGNIKQYSAYYKDATSTCNCPPEEHVVCLPCGGSPVPGKNGQTFTGAMEVKTAWRELTPVDDPSKFFTRTVIVYRQGQDGKIYYDNKVYALIGLHIIHKTMHYPTFIFATWEHVDVQKDTMGFVLLTNYGRDSGDIHMAYPRLHPLPSEADASTEYVHGKLREKNKNSIWLNYRLVGVQSTPTNNQSSFSFFLANYVVESDSTLADFHGSGIGSPHDNKPNTLYRSQRYVMGGCQGCHGANQTKLGGDFSFLMDNVGKPVDTPDIGLNSVFKLRRFINAMQTTKK